MDQRIVSGPESDVHILVKPILNHKVIHKHLLIHFLIHNKQIDGLLLETKVNMLEIMFF